MSSDNRLYWFEWVLGIAGSALFTVLGTIAILRRSISLGGRYGADSFDGPVAVLVGFGLFFVAWWFFRLLLRTTKLRSIWSALGFMVAIVLSALAYASSIDA